MSLSHFMGFINKLAVLFKQVMALGIEIFFLFDKEEPVEKIKTLKSLYNFDIRNGLCLIMTGQDQSEILDNEERLLKLIEKQLKIDLSLLDYWHDEVFENEININKLNETLVKLKSKIKDNPEFYKKINYCFDIEKSYLQNKFSSDVDFLIERLNINIENGSTKVRYESE
ncbi:hypothetical protein [Fluviicola sp.]|uniref:hypothetical protein n=1 Tax=Fluviicola sp. TaxID=1917219 RepID=UPI003D2798CD